jgi:hypothetical protein
MDQYYNPDFEYFIQLTTNIEILENIKIEMKRLKYNGHINKTQCDLLTRLCNKEITELQKSVDFLNSSD